jgi:hypothetical protein
MPIFEADEEITPEGFARQANQAFDRAARKEWCESLGFKEEKFYVGNEHPDQPIEMVDGVARFKRNPIVDFLLKMGPFDLNQISHMLYENSNWTVDDYTQLMQLIGYSVSGYGDLSSSPPHRVARADAIVEGL